MKQPLVSIIISNLNGQRLGLLNDCINSLTKPNYKNWELFVIDNNSDDESVEYLTEKFKRLSNCHVVKNKINMYSQGLNLGAKHAKGKYLAYFNNDVAIKPGYFQELINHFENDANLAIAQGKLLNYFDRTNIDSAGESMDKFGNPITIGANEKDKGQYDVEEEILSASGSACIVKRSVFKKIGGYDPDYGIGYEDMDLALRVRRAGYYVKRFPKAIVYHKRASTDLADFVKIKVKWHFNKNRLSTMLKNYPLPTLLAALPFTLLLYLFIGFWEWLHKNWKVGLTRFTAIWWVLLNLGKILKKRVGVFAVTKKGVNFPLGYFSDKSVISIFRDFLTFHK